jgi:hypothetical protein
MLAKPVLHSGCAGPAWLRWRGLVRHPAAWDVLTEGSLQVLSWYDGASVSRQRGQHCQRWTICLPSIGGVHEKQVEANLYELRMNGLQGGEITMTICGHFVGASILLSSARFTDKISITLPNGIVANNRSALSNIAMQVCRSIDTAGSNEEFSNASSRADFELNLRCTAAPTPARQGGRSDHPSERRVRSRGVLPFERPELVPRRCATPSVVRSAWPSSSRWWRRTTDSEWYPAARNEFEHRYDPLAANPIALTFRTQTLPDGGVNSLRARNGSLPASGKHT